jgi:CheY-like chemotaxis protein
MAVILVVDDDAAIRIQLSSVLSDELGHRLIFASGGEAALANYERHTPDLVITDLVMPGMEGVTFIQRLRSKHPEARVIAISGKGSERLDQAQRAGASAGFRKPLERDAFVTEVARLLARRDPWSSTR